MIIIILASISLLVISCKRNLEDSLFNGKVMTIKGVIRQVGNYPFTELVLSPQDNLDLYLVFTTKDQLYETQTKVGSVQHIKGRILIKELQTADHKITIKRYYLELL